MFSIKKLFLYLKLPKSQGGWIFVSKRKTLKDFRPARAYFQKFSAPQGERFFILHKNFEKSKSVNLLFWKKPKKISRFTRKLIRIFCSSGGGLYFFQNVLDLQGRVYWGGVDTKHTDPSCQLYWMSGFSRFPSNSCIPTTSPSTSTFGSLTTFPTANLSLSISRSSTKSYSTSLSTYPTIFPTKSPTTSTTLYHTTSLTTSPTTYSTSSLTTSPTSSPTSSLTTLSYGISYNLFYKIFYYIFFIISHNFY